MKANTILSLLLVTGLLGLSCADKTPIEKEPQGGSGGGSGGGAPDAQVDAPVPHCPQGLPGAKLVRLLRPDGSSYCIDERETVNAEYKEFLSAVATKPVNQPAECQWNTSFTPPLLMPGDDGLPSGKCPVESWKLDSEPAFAVNCVDFCDAWAFCAWAGKRLCGVGGGSGAKVDVRPSAADAEKVGKSVQSEWYNACTQGGTTKFPYGDTFVPGRCVDPTKLQQAGPSARSTQDTSADECQASSGGFRGVHHLSGNVWEWVNLCTDGGASCTTQGGAYGVAEVSDLACASWGTTWAGSINSLQGIRCCADAVP